MDTPTPKPQDELETLQADLDALESDTPRLEQMAADALEAANTARAALRAGEGDADTLTLASGKHTALAGLLGEHRADLERVRGQITALEQSRAAAEKQRKDKFAQLQLQILYAEIHQLQDELLAEIETTLQTNLSQFGKLDAARRAVGVAAVMHRGGRIQEHPHFRVDDIHALGQRITYNAFLKPTYDAGRNFEPSVALARVIYDQISGQRGQGQSE